MAQRMRNVHPNAHHTAKKTDPMARTLDDAQEVLDLPLRPDAQAREERNARLRAAGIRPATRSLARPRRRPTKPGAGFLERLRRLFG